MDGVTLGGGTDVAVTAGAHLQIAGRGGQPRVFEPRTPPRRLGARRALHQKAPAVPFSGPGLHAHLTAGSANPGGSPRLLSTP